MTIVISAITRCSGGGNHIVVSGTVNGVSRTVQFLRSELDLDPNDGEDLRASFVARCRSAVKEAGATTPQQISAALVNKTFQI